ncbi:SMI1/KNR4 family protein [Ktedonospora formicarum]|uniref:Knr4/Smi1-like domain-containing protein n=1 Tax=Ktedonospora formicarum TaxID=2778364 RepID=A0A8J3IA12_9CHLR|nr:SMI1/KNR4 family protein [Ktedonospora formicarum]GHO51366.1 hypothetical protein KSX_95290 [Ktedonospora formicarum]
MHEPAIILCKRILGKCQQLRWYGGEEYNTSRMSPASRYEVFYDSSGKKITIDNDPDDHPRKTSFAYPPATNEQLLKTEQELGFPLPPLLRALYLHVANGGFGPGYGLLGALEGFDEAGNLVDMYQYHVQHDRLIDLETYPHTWEAEEPLELPQKTWPRSMLYLCDWYGAKVSCIDCITERIFLVSMGKKRHTYRLEFQALSLQEWFEQWMEREPEPDP